MSEKAVPVRTTNDELKSTIEFVACLNLHHERIQNAWLKMQKLCQDMDFFQNAEMIEKVTYLIDRHDITKFEPAEFISYRDHRCPSDWIIKVAQYVGVSRTEITYPSFKEAKRLHILNNPHHWENWTNDKTLTYEQSYIFMLEMLCDWMARGIEQGNTAQEYFNRTKGIIIPDELKYDFYKILKAVS